MVRTSDMVVPCWKQLRLAAEYPHLVYLDDVAAVIAVWAKGPELFQDREHVIMFLLLLSEIMRPIP
jgi:hypothetical protein